MLRGCSLAKMEQLDSVPDMDFELPNGNQQTIKGSIDLRAVTDSRGKERGGERKRKRAAAWETRVLRGRLYEPLDLVCGQQKKRASIILSAIRIFVHS